MQNTAAMPKYIKPNQNTVIINCIHVSNLLQNRSDPQLNSDIQ